MRRTRRLCAVPLAVALATAAGAGAILLGPASPAAATEIVPMPSTGSVTVLGRGNGHGHGMAQYGARGAAIAGLSALQIVAFYYPGSTPVTLKPSTIRVDLSGAGPNTTIAAGPTGLALNGAPLALSGISRYRLVASGSALALQQQATGSSTWVTDKSGLPTTSTFSSPGNNIRVLLTDATSTTYRGTISAVLAGSTVLTVNTVDLDGYTMGVSPRETPASWQPAAVQAQAIAARSYGRYAVEHHGASSYDICDTSACQVYGGMTHYDASGNVLWTDDPAAVQGNSNVVLQYGGATIFAQFSASNGGWTVDGGQPYLVAKADPYDDAASGDPYLSWSRSVPVTDLASHYGLARVSDVQITARDGHGQFGGRVLSAVVDGTDAGGTAQHVQTTGFGLQDAMGLMTNWFDFANAPHAPGAPATVTLRPGDAGLWATWTPPTDDGNSPITGYTVLSGSLSITVSGSARTAFIGPLINGKLATVSVRAVNAIGAGPTVSTSGTPVAAPSPITPLPAARMFDTRPNTLLDATHPISVGIAYHGGIPLTATAAQFALTIIAPTANGVLSVYTTGTVRVPVAAIAYRSGVTSTTTITVPMTPQPMITFRPSAGALNLVADAMGYSAATGSSITPISPVVIAQLPQVPTVAGVAVKAGGLPAGASAVLVGVRASTVSATGWLRLWTSGTAPGVSQVSVAPGSTNTNVVLVPLAADGTFRIAAGTAGLGATITLLGSVGPAAAGAGPLESFQPSAIADSVAGAGTSVTVGSAPVTVLPFDHGQLPHTGPRALLVEFTVTPAGSAGGLFAYAGGSARPTTPALAYSGTSPVTATTVVDIGSGGSIVLMATDPAVRVAVDVLGYVAG